MQMKDECAAENHKILNLIFKNVGNIEMEC